MFNDNDYYKPIKIKRAFNGNYVLYESNGNEDGLLYIHKYLDKIKPHLRDLIGKWKVQLSMNITFISYISPNQIQLMHSKSDNIRITHGVDANDTIQELISTFLPRYQEGLETKMKGSDYIFNHVNSLEYHFHKVSLNRGSSYMPQPEWISHKKSTLNPYNRSDNQCFLYAIVIALNYHNIDDNPQRISI